MKTSVKKFESPRCPKGPKGTRRNKVSRLCVETKSPRR